MHTPLKSIAFAFFVAAAPASFAGTDDTGFQSFESVRALAATGAAAPSAGKVLMSGTDDTGIQSIRDVAGTDGTRVSTARAPAVQGDDATGFQSVAEIRAAASGLI